MRKKKWFTLVEILIVIVIIGILIWALVPRMQWAQWRARDVARKNDLNQLQSAIIVSQQDKWKWPLETGFATNDATWKAIDPTDAELANLLSSAGLNSIPVDPLSASQFSWLGTTNTITGWHYWYVLVKKNWASKWWFVLMAKSETPWWSNYVMCGDSDTITGGTEIKTLKLCSSISEAQSACSGGKCEYTSADQLRYILAY